MVRVATARHRQTLDRISSRSATQIRELWAQLSAYDRAQIAEFARLAAPVAAATKTATVTASAGYFALIAGIRSPAVSPTMVKTSPDLRGPFYQTWSTLSASGDEAAAIAAGANRAAAAMVNFVSSTSRLTAGPVYDRAGVTVHGWLRDPEPNACDWCAEAATTTYSSADATDFGHDNCACLAVPAF